MDLFWSVIYGVAAASFVWLLHSRIGAYPRPLPRSEIPKREIREALSLWGVAVIVPILMIFVISPQLDHVITDRAFRDWVLVPLLSVLCLALPLFVVIKLNRWTVKDLGMTWKSQSRSVSIFAVALGLVMGSIAFVTNQAVIGIELIPWGVLLLLLFTNSFIEELFHRGVIQSLLERAIGQRKAVLWGGILFGLTHVVFDISMLLETGGFPAVFFAVLLQTMAGWLFGIIYMKTRTLWPGIAFHYLINWLPSILTGLIG